MAALVLFRRGVRGGGRLHPWTRNGTDENPPTVSLPVAVAGDFRTVWKSPVVIRVDVVQPTLSLYVVDDARPMTAQRAELFVIYAVPVERSRT